jgi:hypothetical protein
MKKIYEFVLPKTEEVEVSVTEEKDGKEVTTISKETKSVDKKYFIKRPTRKLFDEAELYYGVKLSEGIKAGLLTRALLAKRFSNDGGVLSDTEKKEFSSLYSDLFDKQVELQALDLKTKEQRSPEENAKHSELTQFLANSRQKIQEFEINQSSLYDQTAENRARNKTILWWVLHLSYGIDSDGKEYSFFSGEDLKERLNHYDSIEEEEDDWNLEVVNKFFYYVSFWYVSKTSDPKQFKDLIKFAEQADLGEDLSRHEPTEVEFENDVEDPEGNDEVAPIVTQEDPSDVWGDTVEVEKKESAEEESVKEEPVEEEKKEE